ADGQVHAAHGQAGVEGEACGVADHDHAVRGDLADHGQAALGDQVAAVLDQLAALQVRGDEPVGQEVVEDVGDDLFLFCEVVEADDYAGGQRVEVGVEEAAAAHALGAVADGG